MPNSLCIECWNHPCICDVTHKKIYNHHQHITHKKDVLTHKKDVLTDKKDVLTYIHSNKTYSFTVIDLNISYLTLLKGVESNYK